MQSLCLNVFSFVLSVSPDLKHFRKYLNLDKKEFRNFKYALLSVDQNDAEAFEAKPINMPPGAWVEVKYIFESLIEHGFGV